VIIPLTVVKVSVTVVLKEPFLGWRCNWRQCAAFMLLCLPLHNSGALPPVHELFKCSRNIFQISKWISMKFGIEGIQHEMVAGKFNFGACRPIITTLREAKLNYIKFLRNAPRYKTSCMTRYRYLQFCVIQVRQKE
jgi:hypothetical protein